MACKFILGTVQFGLDYGINNTTGKPTSDQVFEILEYAALRGIDILDTADAYGNALELLGNFNKTHPFTFAINTKFKSDKILIEEQLANTLRILQVTNINTYFYHDFYDFLNYPELLASLIALKKEGKIKKIGISIYDNSEFKTAIQSREIDVIQFPFNLLDNRHQRGELMMQAKIYGKELQARSVFLQGLLFKTPNNIPQKLIPLKQYIVIINELSNRTHLTIEELALTYAFQQKEIDYVIIGVDNLQQLKRNLSIAENRIIDEVIDSIDKIQISDAALLYPKNW